MRRFLLTGKLYTMSFVFVWICININTKCKSVELGDQLVMIENDEHENDKDTGHWWLQQSLGDN